MKANELRIGNYINQISEFKVIAIEQELVQLEDGSWHSYNFIFPIPITEERILKFGFEKYESEKFVSSIILTKNIVSSGLKKIVLFNYPRTGFSVGFVDYYNGRENTETLPTEIKYVHELQNFYFAIKGEELLYTSQ